jgi:hypothetical protein
MTPMRAFGVCWASLHSAFACWLRFQQRVAAFHSFLLAMATLALLAGNMWLLYALVVQDVNPLERDRVVSVSPNDRYLDRGRLREFRIIREVCSSRSQQVEVLRAWTELSVAQQARPIVVFTSVYYDLVKGCHELTVVQAIPETLPPAKYMYEVAVRACNVLNHCLSRPLTPIPVTVVGGDLWPGRDPGYPPPMDRSLPIAPRAGPARDFVR